jgi:transcriptional/translational regulatory protein YebC/TACO1
MMRQLQYIVTFVNLVVCKKKIEELNIEITNSELQRIPTSTKKITTEQAQKVFKILDLLEENDDVQQVFHNMELTEEILKVMDTE